MMSDNATYPEAFYRGITSKSHFVEGYLTPDAFLFTQNTERNDDYKEASINWNDDDGALLILTNQKNESDGSFHFSGGVTEIQLSKMKMALAVQIDRGDFSYERRPVEGNKYHGNLLVKKNLPKHVLSTIRYGLASLGSQKYTPKEEP